MSAHRSPPVQSGVTLDELRDVLREACAYWSAGDDGYARNGDAEALVGYREASHRFTVLAFKLADLLCRESAELQAWVLERDDDVPESDTRTDGRGDGATVETSATGPSGATVFVYSGTPPEVC